MSDSQAAADGVSEPSVGQWAATAWRDALAAFQQMPGVLGIAALASFVIHLVAFPLFMFESHSLGGNVASTLALLLDSFVMTPAAIAVHRFVLLGECATKYRLEPSEPRFRRFFFFVFMINLVTSVPVTLAILADTYIPGKLGNGVALLFVAMVVVGMILVLRSLLLFPAVAVDAPGVAWTNALQDTKGHTLHMLVIVFLTGIPLVIGLKLFSGALYYVLSSLGALTLSRFVAAMVQTIEALLTAVLYAGLASRMFAAFGDRLKAPPDQPAAA